MKSQFGSGLWPVVQRELRAAARWPLGPWLRMGGALVGVFTLFSLTTAMPASVLGAQLFSRIHLLLLCMICGLVPALTADCIARERREGTLGLLFMTPLSASGIVLGKSLAQTLRAVTLWLAVLPLLTIPFLYGGVTWADVAGFFTIELCAGMICLAAGVLASSLTDNRAIAFILAFLFMGAFVAESNQFRDWMISSTRPVGIGLYSATFAIQSGNGFVRTGFSPYGPTPGSFGFGPRLLPARILVEDFLIAAIILLAALRFAGWCVERSWQDKIPSVRQQSWIKRYCSPIFARWFAHSMKRTLEWNPIAWLQQYSWKARLSKWGLCLLFVLLECYVIDGNNPYALCRMVTALLLILAAAYTYAGVNGFLQEKKSGALELILVSPISVQQIIFGRVWGLWKQFLPSFVLLVASSIAVNIMIPNESGAWYGGSWHPGYGQFWLRDIEIVALYLTLPVIATCFALSARNLFVASALTVAIVFGPATLLLFQGYLDDVLFSSASNGTFLFGLRLLLNVVPLPPLPICVILVQAYFVFFTYNRLRRNLARRSYAF